jgi:mRNA interferase RelE/StbE
MAPNVEFRPEAIADLERLDRVIAQRILDKIKWLIENFDTISPQALTGDMKGLFKLRVGDYRVIYSINQSEKLITIHLIGHRRQIYR